MTRVSIDCLSFCSELTTTTVSSANILSKQRCALSHGLMRRVIATARAGERRRRRREVVEHERTQHPHVERREQRLEQTQRRHTQLCGHGKNMSLQQDSSRRPNAFETARQ